MKKNYLIFEQKAENGNATNASIEAEINSKEEIPIDTKNTFANGLFLTKSEVDSYCLVQFFCNSFSVSVSIYLIEKTRNHSTSLSSVNTFLSLFKWLVI